MKYIGKLLARTLAVLIAAYIIPGVHIDNDSIFIAIVVALVLSLLNSFVKPLLIILTIPATIMTFGLFLIVINVIIIYFADAIVDGFRVDGFWWALLFSVTLSLFNSLLEPPKEKNKNDFDD